MAEAHICLNCQLYRTGGCDDAVLMSRLGRVTGTCPDFQPRDMNEAVAAEAQKPLESDYIQEIEFLKAEVARLNQCLQLAAVRYKRLEEEIERFQEVKKKEITELQRRIPLEKEIEMLRRLLDAEHELKTLKEQAK